MDDLIKRLSASCYLAFEDGTNDYSAAQEAIDRIEELVKGRKAMAMRDAGYDVYAGLEAKLTKAEEERDGYLAGRNKFQLYLQRTHADLELEVAAVEALNAKLTECEARLSKAIAALRNILSGDDLYPWRIAREVLAELEGK